MVNCVSRGSGGRRIDSQNASRETLAVEAFHCCLEIPCILEFNETEPSGMTSHAVAYNLRERDGMALIFEPLP
jgi:hypothetical protein